MTTLSLTLQAKFTEFSHKLRQYRLPWEIGTVATAWVSYVWIMLIVVILATSTACAAVQAGAPAYTEPLAGQIQPVHMGAVLERIHAIATGRYQGLILYNPENRSLVFAWQHLQGYAYACINGSSTNICNALRTIGGKGTYLNVDDFRLVMSTAIERYGYGKITPEQLTRLAPGLVTSILQSAAATAASTLPNIIVVPLGAFDMPNTGAIQ